MFYAGSVGSAVMTAGIPGARHYMPAAPMSAVMPGQHYYPAMHSAPVGYPMTAAPMMYNTPQYAHASPYGYYGGQPTVIVSSPPSRRHRSRSRPRHGHGHSSGFLGYL